MTAPHVIRGHTDLRVLLEAARAGDSAAFRDLYHRFARVVHGIVLSQVGPDDVDDVTQEVFVSIYRKLDKVRDAEGLPAWICTLARNASIDQLRRRKRRLDTEAMPEVVAPSRGDRELGVRVLTLVRTLPESYQETLILRLVEGLTGPEIAERTGMTHGSVRVNLNRGMSQLRPLLEKDGWP